MPSILERVSERDGADGGTATLRANRPGTSGEGAQKFLPVERLREQYLNYLTSKGPEIEEMREARRYYHSAQWSEEDIRILRARRQPVVTYNRIGRKINGVVGLVQRVRQDAKGYPRSPRHEDDAEIATTVVREILDASDWRTLESECIRFAAFDGIAGCEKRLVEGDHDDPDILLAQVFADDYFYDPRSFKPDFSDARYEGVAKWTDIEEAVELFPEHEELLRSLISSGSDLTTRSDREFKWVLSSEQQVRLVEHWYRYKGEWCWAFYVSNVLLDEGVSPFFNARRKTDRRFEMFSTAVDHDGDRYGLVRGLKSAQDETNQRRSKMWHLSNSRRLKVEKGAVDNINRTREEYAKADGVIEVNVGRMGGVEADDTTPDLAAQSQLYQDAKAEIEGFANTNVLNMTQGSLQNISGYALNLLQQPGLAELGPFILAIRGWKLRVYRSIFCAAQHNWKAERWLRVTDNDKLAQFLQVNGLEIDDAGVPRLVNALGALDVDIILDEGPDVVNMMQDTFDVLKNQPPGTIPPQVLIELAPIQGSVKQKILKMLQPPPPPPPDPLDVRAKELAVESIAADVENAKAQAKERGAAVISKRASAVKDVFAAVASASKAGIPGAPVADIGMQSAPIAPAPAGLGQPMTPVAPEPAPPMQFAPALLPQIQGDQPPL